MELIIYIKMNLALNNLQRLICHKTQQTKPNCCKEIKILTYDYTAIYRCLSTRLSSWTCKTWFSFRRSKSRLISICNELCFFFSISFAAGPFKKILRRTCGPKGQRWESVLDYALSDINAQVPPQKYKRKKILPDFDELAKWPKGLKKKNVEFRGKFVSKDK